jgi:uncharacterized protein YceH (UPF0502 family)
VDTLLNDMETRILGCLIEKELTTPDYYPLSLNALVNACNQKSNRDPIIETGEEEVIPALDSLRFKQLVVVSAEGGRVPKYRHILAEKLGLLSPELAVMCELLVRGPQTGGELRTRAERMHPFPDSAAMEEILRELMEREPPLVTRLARQPGRKEPRYAHLFSGTPEPAGDDGFPPPEPGRLRVMAENERVTRLEHEVAALREEVAGLQRTFQDFRAQFE